MDSGSAELDTFSSPRPCTTTYQDRPMKNFDTARSFTPASASALGDDFIPAPSGFAAARFVEPAFDVENWLGYESIHPLTWVPGPAADGGLHFE